MTSDPRRSPRQAIAGRTATLDLTRREREVAELVAQGLTNRQIADRLFLSERTAEYHVEQIRNKLGFHARSQIATWITAQRAHPSNGDTQPIVEGRRAFALPRPASFAIDSRVKVGVAIVAGLLLVGGGGLMVSPVLNHAANPGSLPGESLVRLDAATGAVAHQLALDAHGTSVLMAEGSLWVISYTDGTLLRVDPRTQTVIRHARVPGNAPPVGLAAGGDSIWVSTAFGVDSLREYDPRTDQWKQPVPLSSGLEGVAYGSSAVWVANKAENAVYRIDPVTATVTAQIAVGGGPEAIVADASGVWVANAVGASVSRIDPRSNAVTAVIGLRASPTALAIGAGAVWVASEAASLLVKIDPRTNQATAVPYSGVGPSSLAVSGSTVWVGEGLAGRILKIDADTYRAQAVSVGGWIEGMSAGDGSLWVARHVLSNPQPATATLPRGGTLRIAVPAWKASDFADPAGLPSALDPQLTATLDADEVLRCCLMRTLLSHAGTSYRDGGAELRPDLARELPGVSADGLTWTFEIRPGLHYSPPLQATEITAPDFIRSLQRDARVAGSTTFSVIEGFDAYAAGHGNPSTISGLDAPDRYTLRVHLNQVTGDLPYRFALSESAPIPPSPVDPKAPYGVATGHDDGAGRFMVGSGPYMIEGSAKLDFTRPAGGQTPVSGFQPGRSLTLVRNPTWTSATDPLRPAYVDRIEISLGLSHEEAASLIESGAADLILNGSPPPQALPSLVDEFQRGRGLGTVQVHDRDFLRALEMNVAMPPFDDIHVRKAVNYILDKRALRKAHGGDMAGRISTHYVPNSLEANVLSDYDPYATPDDAGSITLARQEMSQSRYDPGHTGMCTSLACRHVLAISIGTSSGGLFPRLYGGFPALAAIISDELKQIGIIIDLHSTPPLSTMADDPSAKIAMNLTVGLGSAETWMSASSSFAFDFSAGAVGGSLVGATPEQLRGWGYSVTSVPNIDGRLHECAQGGIRQAECWTALDIYVMENVVPVAPYTMETVIDVVPNRVVHYSYDQSSDEVALDQIALKK